METLVESDNLSETTMRDILKDEFTLLYKTLSAFNTDINSRITPLVIISEDEEPAIAVSIIEREFAGSESYAVMIYRQEFSAVDLITQTEPIEKMLINNKTFLCSQCGLLFTEDASIDRLMVVAERTAEALSELQ